MSRIKSIQDPEVQSLLSQAPTKKDYHKSPTAWEDQVIYFLLPDRFSNGDERGYKDIRGNFVTSGTTPLFSEADLGNAISNDHDKKEWVQAGRSFVGGTLNGLRSKLGYIKSMGITAIWIGPIFKQVAGLETYHGYGIQNFLDVDHRFGTKEDLQELVRAAHEVNIYVILDVILNHSGNTFAYKDQITNYTGKTHKVKGFWPGDRRYSQDMLPFGLVDEHRYPNAFPDGAIWPAELQDPSNFTCKGSINDWDALPESVEGDFFDLKSLNLGPSLPSDLETFVPSSALDILCKVYQYWLAYADFDGFRIDTVRHMGDGPTRYFSSAIHNFAQSVGKSNFLLIGEISNHRAREIVLATGLDAALSIGPLQLAMHDVPRGRAPAADYFDSFTNASYDAHRWARNQMVTMIDDHDQIFRKDALKARFCSYPDGPVFIQAAIGLNLCTLGIPCIYYGTEQNFAGTSDGRIKSGEHYTDSFIREAMFGGAFGAFYSRNRHFFDDSSATYSFIRDITLLRANEVALRRGDQYVCTVSPASIFHRLGRLANAAPYRRHHSVLAWARVYREDVVLCAINTSNDGPARAWISLFEERLDLPTEDVAQRLYPLDDVQDLKVVRRRDGGAKVLLTVPAAGFVIYKFISRVKDQ
jgi:glycosidase